MKLTKTKKILLISVAAAAVGLILNYIGFAAIQSANNNVSRLEQELAIFQNRDSEFSGKKKDELVAQIDKINSYILPKDGAVSFIEKIQTDAKIIGAPLQIDSVDIDPPPPDDYRGPKPIFDTVRIHLESTGTWQSLDRIIFYLEHLPYKINLDNISLSQGDSGGSVDSSGKAIPVKKNSAPLWRLIGEITIAKQK